MTIDFIGVVVPLSILLPLFIALIRWKYLSTGARFIFLYLLVSALINMAATLMGKYLHKNNMPLVHVLTALEVIIFLLYYRETLSQKKKALFYGWLGSAFVLFCIFNAVFLQSIYTYSSYTRSAEAIILILFALNYFAKQASLAPAQGKIIQQPGFYFNAGIFLYFSGALMLFIFSNFIITNLSKANFLIIWNIHGVLLLLMYVLFGTGFLLCRK